MCKASWEKIGFEKGKWRWKTAWTKEERTEGESAFQRLGPIEGKDQDWAKAVLLRGTKSSSLSKERSGRLEEAQWGRNITSTRYFGTKPRWALKIRVRFLNCRPIRARRGSQCSSSTICRNVRVPGKEGYQSCSFIEDHPNWIETNLRKTNEKGIAEVNSRT